MKPIFKGEKCVEGFFFVIIDINVIGVYENQLFVIFFVDGDADRDVLKVIQDMSRIYFFRLKFYRFLKIFLIIDLIYLYDMNTLDHFKAFYQYFS